MTAWTLFTFILGFVLLVGGAEVFVRGATRLAIMLGVGPLVVGLTVVALGTTAPEIAVSVLSALEGKPDLALGNVVGSNILNVLFILGVAATIAPLTVSRQLIRMDVPIMICVSLLALVLAMDGALSRWNGALLLGLAVAYSVFTVLLARREKEAPEDCEFADKYAPPPEKSRALWLSSAAFIVVGATALVFGSRWLVAGAIVAARAMGISEMVIGLTVVAVGTSLPEVATSVMASIRGQRDIAVGNVVGSNIYNVLAVLGAGAVVGPVGITISPAALRFDLPVLTAVSLACLPIFFTGSRISRPEGILFLAYYVMYTVYLVLASSHHTSLPAFSGALIFFVVPLTVMWIGFSVVRAVWAKRAG
jgi:cation:H+ antiporter